MRIALEQPEIAGNVGAVLRLAACFAVPVDIIEPLGFAWSDARVRRAGMDYADRVDVSRHADWAAFRAARPGRIVLLTTHGDTALSDVAFSADDILLMGSEGSGATPVARAAAAIAARIPIAPGLRSLNLSVATGIAVHEALRQTGALAR
jgi:tRNA (cytidine/uridine-2'-O-)-methyltransferase